MYYRKISASSPQNNCLISISAFNVILIIPFGATEFIYIYKLQQFILTIPHSKNNMR